MKELDLSIIMITKNEERDLPCCFASLPQGAEVVVVDSGSTDRTVKIAKEYGAKVIISPFVNYADQRNKALQLATKSWVFSIDADEIMSADLRHYLQGELRVPAHIGGFHVKIQLYFMGHKMRYGGGIIAPLRLFRRGGGVFARQIHERMVVSSDYKVGELDTGMLYHNGYFDLSDLVHKFNVYTTMMAESCHVKGKKVPPLITLRPFWNFFLAYVIKLGFLDGYPGYCYALLNSCETFVKYTKLGELYRREQKTETH